MSTIKISTEVAALLERVVATGRSKTAAAFVEEAVRRLAEEADTDDSDLAAHVAAGDADIAAGRFILIETEDDQRRLHEANMARLTNELGSPR